MKIEQEYKCDVLVVGGGIAGLMAAIAAADRGASVILAEKANTMRSGAGTTGNDHFICYIPEYHGPFEAFMKELHECQSAKNCDDALLRRYAARTFEVAQDWHSWGINMKTRGDTWHFSGHAFPGRMRIHLKYDGRNQKKVLTQQAKKRGVQIVNNCPITEFLPDETGRIVGALGVDISGEMPSLSIFRAKATVTATGATTRLYPSITPTLPFNISNCPANSGTGVAAAFRRGASVTNIEYVACPAGPKYFARAGKGTWIGVLRDAQGDAVGPFVNKPNWELGDITSDVWPTVFRDKQMDGTGPVYCDCHEIEDEDFAYMQWGLSCEGDTSLLEAMEHQNINLRRHMVEFGSYPGGVMDRGLLIDETCGTTLPGLFAAGNQIGNMCGHMSGAAVTGRIAGEAAAESAQTTALYAGDLLRAPVVLENQARYEAFLARKEGASWKEVNAASSQIMEDYCSAVNVRSQTLLTSGIKYLEDLKRNAEENVCCANAHELLRTLEAFDLIELSRLICVASLARQESRGGFRRSDYTFTNPIHNGESIVVDNIQGVPTAHWRAPA